MGLNPSLRETAEQLPRSEEAFRAVWENAADAMAISDAEGTVLMANRAYHRLYGYGPEDVIGQNFAVIFPPEVRVWANEQYRAIFASETIPPAFEASIRRKDGAERLVESRIDFLTDQGERTAMITIVRDVTERARLEDAERRTRAAAEAAVRSRDELLNASRFVRPHGRSPDPG